MIATIVIVEVMIIIMKINIFIILIKIILMGFCGLSVRQEVFLPNVPMNSIRLANCGLQKNLDSIGDPTTPPIELNELIYSNIHSRCH